MDKFKIFTSIIDIIPSCSALVRYTIWLIVTILCVIVPLFKQPPSNKKSNTSLENKLNDKSSETYNISAGRDNNINNSFNENHFHVNTRNYLIYKENKTSLNKSRDELHLILSFDPKNGNSLGRIMFKVKVLNPNVKIKTFEHHGTAMFFMHSHNKGNLSDEAFCSFQQPYVSAVSLKIIVTGETKIRLESNCFEEPLADFNLTY